jgi:hypothetical protein
VGSCGYFEGRDWQWLCVLWLFVGFGARGAVGVAVSAEVGGSCHLLVVDVAGQVIFAHQIHRPVSLSVCTCVSGM